MRNLIRALIAVLSLATLPAISQAEWSVGVSVGIAPPALPVYVQPPCPAPGYMWTPGYWAWGDDGYYWVPGTWMLPPTVGVLWTPGYWGWSDGFYLWHAGYWGPHVGFYGGINYGFGYAGVGYEGGYWHGRDFYYNRSVTNVSTTNITNVYNRTVINNNNVNVTRVSFNGGAGGVMARPNRAQISAEHERRSGLTPVQRQQEQQAHGNSALRAAVNGGRPAIAATPRAGEFAGHGVVAARGAEHGAALFAARGAERGGEAARANEGRANQGREGRALPETNSPRFDRPATAEHAPPEAHTNVPMQERSSPHAAQYGARSPERPQYEPRPAPQSPAHAVAPQYQAHPGAQYQGRPAPQYQGHPAPQYPAQPAPQYQGHPAPQNQGHPAPQYQPHPAPQYQGHAQPQYQPRPAPQAAGHAGPQAQRPDHGPGEHNRQG